MMRRITASIEIQLVIIYIFLVGSSQVKQHPQRNVYGKFGLCLHQENQFVPNLEAQVVGDTIGQDVFQRNQFAVRLRHIGILGMECQIQLPGVFRLAEHKAEYAVLRRILHLSHSIPSFDSYYNGFRPAAQVAGRKVQNDLEMISITLRLY